MPVPVFQRTQIDFAGHLRNPDGTPAPAGIEDRRMGIYRDLIYNNIESFLSSGFPVLRKITADDHWHSLVRDFIASHRCRTPYFLRIGEEFLRYLQDSRVPEGWEPPFLLELCHYEWVELALDTADAEIPPPGTAGVEPLDRVYRVSPLAWRLAYRYPVHRISPDFQPREPAKEGVHLLVHRNRADEVRFMEINPVVSRLIQLVDSREDSLRALLTELAREIDYPDTAAFFDFALTPVARMEAQAILVPVSNQPPG